MAKLKENSEYVASVPLSVALEMIEHPERIESPDGWGPYVPSKKYVFENGHTNINGTAMHESDLHAMNLLIIPPNLANRALARVLKKEPCANVNVLIEPVADWVLERHQDQTADKIKWVAKNVVKDTVGELAQ